MVGGLWCEHLETGSIGAHDVRGAHPVGQHLDDGRHQIADSRDPVRERRHGHRHAAAREHAVLAVNGAVVEELGHRHVRKQRRSGGAAERLHRAGCGVDAELAAAAGVLTEPPLVLHEVSGDVFEDARGVGADSALGLTAARARPRPGLELDAMLAALDLSPVDARRALAVNGRPALVELLLELGVRLGIGPHLLGLRLGWGVLGRELLEQERELPGVDLFASLARALATELVDEQRELAILVEHRTQRRDEQIERLVGAAFGHQRLRVGAHVLWREDVSRSGRGRRGRRHRCVAGRNVARGRICSTRVSRTRGRTNEIGKDSRSSPERRGGAWDRLRSAIPTSLPCGSSQIDPFENHRELGRVDLDVPSADQWRLGERERPALETLVDEQVSRAIPHEDFDPVSPTVEPAEQMPGEWILTDHLARRGGQAVEAAA